MTGHESVYLCPACRLDRVVTRLHNGACWKHGTLWHAYDKPISAYRALRAAAQE